MDALFRNEVLGNFPRIRKIPSTTVKFYCDYATTISIERLTLLWEYQFARSYPMLAASRGIGLRSEHHIEMKQLLHTYTASVGTWDYIDATTRRNYIAEWRSDPQGAMSGFRDILGVERWEHEVHKVYPTAKQLRETAHLLFTEGGFSESKATRGGVAFRTDINCRPILIEMAFGSRGVQFQYRITVDGMPPSLEAVLGVIAPSDWDLIECEQDFRVGLSMIIEAIVSRSK